MPFSPVSKQPYSKKILNIIRCRFYYSATTYNYQINDTLQFSIKKLLFYKTPTIFQQNLPDKKLNFKRKLNKYTYRQNQAVADHEWSV